MSTRACTSKLHQGERELPATTEYFYRATRGGLHSWCRWCFCEYDRLRREARKQERAAKAMDWSSAA